MELKNESMKRSTTEIQAEIECLQQELQQAYIEERSATYNGKFPVCLYAWDMYLGKDEIGTWCSAEKDGFTWDGRVFETEEEATSAAWTLLNELADENELRGDPDDYTIDTFTIPLIDLTVDFLEECNLEHLVPAIIE